MAIDGRKLVNYLAHGISHSQIAAALNLSEGRISQLAQEDRVLDAVRKRKEELAEEDVTEVTELKNIKKTLLGKLEELATSSESLSESVNAFEKIDKIISTKMGQENSDNGVRAIIMQAPIFIQQNLPSEVVLDSRNRIASIRGRNMAQMPTQGVLKILQQGGGNHVPKTIDQREIPVPEDFGGLQL